LGQQDEVVRVGLESGPLSAWHWDELKKFGVPVIWELPQDLGSGGDRHWRAWLVGWLELLSKAGTGRTIIDSAPNLKQKIGTTSRPTHLL